MPVTKVQNLTSPTDVINEVLDHLVGVGSPRTGGEGWTILRQLAPNSEVWIQLEDVNTFNGQRIIVGFKSTGVNTIELICGDPDLTATEAMITGSPSNDFNRIIGTPNKATGPSGNFGDTYRGISLPNGNSNTPANTTQFFQAGNYANTWVITPPVASPLGSPTSERYCYCVTEVAEGVFTTFGFGEAIKLGAAAWEGGVFFDGSVYDNIAGDARADWFCGGGIAVSGTGNNRTGYIYNKENFIFRNDSPQFWSPWTMMGEPAVLANLSAGMGFDHRAFGADLINLAPAAFSGEAPRQPARFYVNDDNPPNNMVPLAEVPDVFHLSIADLQPGIVFTDDQGDKFLTVPYSSKGGATSSGNRGFLIRNPDLI